MPIKAAYKCVECQEIFDNKIQSIKHHLETKHMDFEMLGCGISVKMRSA